MKREVLRMERVSSHKQGVEQLNDFNLSILEGEIMGLLPVNNNGLTALLELLQHNTTLRYGYVYYCEKQVNTWRTSKQRGNRIGIIQSESCLIDEMTVSDNIFVLRRGFKTWYIKPSMLKRKLIPFLEDIDINIPADAYVGELSAFEKIIVDVLKSVVAGCKLIILRDISTNICENELKKIHKLLKHYTNEGISFLYIDFHFEDMRQICDKVVLMSNGRIIKMLQGDEATPENFVNYTNVYIDKVKRNTPRPATFLSEKTPVFEAKNISSATIKNLSFTVYARECVVLQDIDNLIFDEFLSVLTGETTLNHGEILVNNTEVSSEIGKNIAIINELPSKSMIFKEMSYLDNVCFSLDRHIPQVWSSKSIKDGVGRELSKMLGESVVNTRVDMLSEAQKYELVYTRVALQRPVIAFCLQPFRGADIKMRMHIWELLEMLLHKNIAVVILAVNLADSLSLADRLIRIKKDKPEEIYMRSEFSAMPIVAPWMDLHNEIKSMSASHLQ